jgi:hypothetical protein
MNGRLQGQVSLSCWFAFIVISLLSPFSYLNIICKIVTQWPIHPHLLWFRYEVSTTKAFCIENLVPDASCVQSGALGKWLDHEGSAFINGLIQLWIQILSRLLGGSGTVEHGIWLEEVGHWWCILKRYLTLASSSLSVSVSWPPSGEQLCSTMPFCHALPPWCSTFPHPRNNRTSWPWTATSEIMSHKSIFLPLSCLCQVFCHDEILTQCPLIQIEMKKCLYFLELVSIDRNENRKQLWPGTKRTMEPKFSNRQCWK